MSKRDQLSGGLNRRTTGSAYDENQEFSLGDDFMADLESPQPDPELMAEKERLEQELTEKEAKLQEVQEEVSAIKDRAIVQRDDGTMVMGRVTLDKTGMTLPDNLTKDEWAYIGDQLFTVEASLQWCIGDWLLYGETHQYGDYKQIAETLGKHPGTLYNWKWVSSEMSREPAQDQYGNTISYRYEVLSHTHHQVVVSMVEKDDYAYWLQRAVEGDDGKVWSIARLKQEITKAKRQQNPPKESADDELSTGQIKKLMKLVHKDVSRLSAEDADGYLADVIKLKETLKHVEAKLKKRLKD